MDHEQVRTLEDEIEITVTAVIEKHFRRRNADPHFAECEPLVLKKSQIASVASSLLVIGPYRLSGNTCLPPGQL